MGLGFLVGKQGGLIPESIVQIDAMRFDVGNGHRLERLPEPTPQQPVRISDTACAERGAVGEDPGIVNLPAMILIVMCALLLIRGAVPGPNGGYVVVQQTNKM